MRAVWSLLLCPAVWAQVAVLPGTSPLEDPGDLALQMVEGIDRYLSRRLVAVASRGPVAMGAAAAEPLRWRLRTILGAVDARVPFDDLLPEATLSGTALVARTPAYEVYAVRWPVLEGVDAQGLLLAPAKPLLRAVVLPDADWTPEDIAGLTARLPAASQYARRLAESGCQVLAPVLISREDTASGNPALRFTNQPHREFIHRMAFEMGRTVIGYELQKVQAAVDWFSRQKPVLPIGVAGYGEGGLLALYAAALDARLERALVSGYFGPRANLWREPIYRSVWSLLPDFGDAELAALIAPRTLVIEAAAHSVAGPPPERPGRRGAASGRIETSPPDAVRAEAARGGVAATHVIASPHPGSSAALQAFLGRAPAALAAPPRDQRSGFDPDARQKRQFDQLVAFTQRLVRQSDGARRTFWAQADFSSPARLRDTTAFYRAYFWNEILGRLPDPTGEAQARSRRQFDFPTFQGYEVKIPVFDEVFAYGVLLVPKDLKPNERRPVVVTQHGLEGRPQALVDPGEPRDVVAYSRYAARLAERGFVVYAPQNPYIFGERFRLLLRKAHPLKLSLFSFIVAQHRRTLDWLVRLPFVDPERIALYGLSYGGKTAMRVPPLEARYAVVICSGDFNEWIWKITSVDQPFSYLFTPEHDVLEFDLGNTFNYAELAHLIAPRPFMVERGHHDGVGIDEWVAYEFAKVRRSYALLRLPENAAIEFFNGPHAIWGLGTFEFLHRHLRWP